MQDLSLCSLWLPLSLCDLSHKVSQHDVICHKPSLEIKQVKLTNFGISVYKSGMIPKLLFLIYT